MGSFFPCRKFFRCRSERGSRAPRGSRHHPAYSNQVSVMGKGRKCARGYTLQSGPEGPSWCRSRSRPGRSKTTMHQVRVGCALPTAPSAKNRRQACPLRLANLTFVCLMFEIMLCAPATVDHVSFGCIYPRVKTYSKDDTFTYRSAHGCEKCKAKG